MEASRVHRITQADSSRPECMHSSVRVCMAVAASPVHRITGSRLQPCKESVLDFFVCVKLVCSSSCSDCSARPCYSRITKFTFIDVDDGGIADL